MTHASVRGGSQVPVCVLNHLTIEEVEGVVLISSNPSNPDRFQYKLLRCVSGPQAASGENYDLNTDSDAVPSVFEYQASEQLKFARINFSFSDGSIGVNDFAGIAGGLANGCLFQIVGTDNSILLDFTDGAPIKQNFNFSLLAGIDVDIAPGNDQLLIRFSIYKAGALMRLAAGQKIRWTNRDDLSSITNFRAMAQCVLN